MRRSILLTVFAAIAAFTGACTETKPVDTKPGAIPVSSPVGSPVTTGSPLAGEVKKTAETLVGKWKGPEGTFLNVVNKGDKFEIEIKNLDGSKTYEGTAKGETIEFARNGKTESIKHATGEETGMKDLAQESNCVVITKGSEGFCQKAEAKPATK